MKRAIKQKAKQKVTKTPALLSSVKKAKWKTHLVCFKEKWQYLKMMLISYKVKRQTDTDFNSQVRMSTTRLLYWYTACTWTKTTHVRSILSWKTFSIYIPTCCSTGSTGESNSNNYGSFLLGCDCSWTSTRLEQFTHLRESYKFSLTSPDGGKKSSTTSTTLTHNSPHSRSRVLL